jgi:DNA-binding MarR family transcriptional regulator
MLAVELTTRGEKLLLKILPEHFRRMAWLMAPLSETERKTFVRLLTKLLHRAAEAHPAPETVLATAIAGR